jgi:hypothetical protein
MRKASLVGLAAVPAVLLAAAPAHAEDKGTVGVGVILGEPTGICARIYIKDDQAIDAAVGSAFVGGGIQLHADYVFHPYILQERESFTLPFYVGPGIRVIDYRSGRGDDYGALGLRGVVGLLFDFKKVPLDVFAEVAIVGEHGLSAGHDFNLTLNAGAGVRYYF